MKKGTLLSVVSLLVAIGGAIIAIAAYRKNHCQCCEDDMDFDDFDFLDDDDTEYFSAEVEEAPDCDCLDDSSEESETKPEKKEEHK